MKNEEKILNDIKKLNALADMNDALNEDLEYAIVKYNDINKSSLGAM